MADHRDIDLCIINGFSFPAHVGGILFWADRHGIDRVNEMLERLAVDEDKLKPNARLRTMQEQDRRFYNR